MTCSRLSALIVVLLVGVGGTAVARPRAAVSAGAALVESLRRELGLTRSASEVHQGLEAIERERASLQYTAAILDHASNESMRRLGAYADGQDTREGLVRARARALYKLARGGAARLAFGESLGDDARGSTAVRLARARTLHTLVRRDLHQLASHRRARMRARSELLSATRELDALGAVATMFEMEGDVLTQAGTAFDPELSEAAAKRKLDLRRAGDKARRANRELVALVKENWRELSVHRGLDVAELRRPVPGKIVGGFGSHQDRVLRVAVQRSGVELAAARGEKVIAMAAGRVVLVSELPDFGQAVVIEHGGGQYSLTARLWDLRVREGDAVAGGTVIGRVAPKAEDDGLGPTVYVELRHGEKPVDPAAYLARARPPARTAKVKPMADAPTPLE